MTTTFSDKLSTLYSEYFLYEYANKFYRLDDKDRTKLFNKYCETLKDVFNGGNKRVVIPVSGGFDSFFVYHLTRYINDKYDLTLEILAVKVSLGVDYDIAESITLENLSIPTHTIDVGFFDKGLAAKPTAKNPVVVNRNLAFASITSLLGPDYILFGNPASDIFNTRLTDCNADFHKDFSRTLSTSCGKDVLVFSPIAGLSKSDMYSIAKQICHDTEYRYFAAYNKTFSCYAPSRTLEPCGKCSACFRKWVMETNNGEPSLIGTETLHKLLRSINQREYTPEYYTEMIDAVSTHMESKND